MGNRDERPRDGGEIVRTGAELARLSKQDQELAQNLVERARSEGLNLVGEDGLLKGLVKLVLEGALEAEMSDHLGYERGDRAGQGSGNSRNGSSRKRVLTDVGAVDIEVPKDRAGSFEPAIVPKHQRRVEGFDEAILSLYAKGLTTGEIQPIWPRSTTSTSYETSSRGPPTRSPKSWMPGGTGRRTVPMQSS
ncbi:transposase [Streptomyces sp. TRM66268-LWL]|uniref:Mutator family transposase n=1 Tax=Streptomyces polyasparticus TaxID=2767826 RepID=A0ABR7SXN4_9ACTN|nr:transposase [Streptomyces polyasparticus]MBC9719732.1 transposase [Streptomyces polyasparticus]